MSAFADEIIRLRNVGIWSGGGTPSKANPVYWDNGDIPWVSPKDMKTFELHDSQDKITAKAVEASSAKLVPAGSVLMVVRSGILAHTFPVAIARTAVTLNQDMKAITPKGGLSSEFLAYQLRAQESTILKSCTKSGTTVASVETKQLQSLPFWVPSAELQTRIVEELDKQLSRLEATVTTLQGIQAKLKQARASILKAAVEGRLVPPIQSTKHHKNASRLDASTLLEQIKLSTEEYLGKKIKRNMDTSHSSSAVGLQPGWCLARLSDLGVFGRGKSRHRPRNDSRLFGGAYPFIQTGEVAASKGRITHHTYTYSEFGLSQSKLWPKHTLCITIAANIANTGILQIDACFPDSVVGLYCPLTQSVVKYAEIFIGSIKGKLEELAPATAQKNINLKILDDLHIPLPPLVELCQIVNEVDRRFSVLDQVEATVQTSLTRCTKLRQAILKRAFEGRLVPAA